MVTLLFTSVFIIGFLAVALYFWQKPAKVSEHNFLPLAPPARGLFEPNTTEPRPPETNAADSEPQRSLVVERARSGDKSTLEDAQRLGDKKFYDEILNILVAAADSDAGLLSLMSYVARHELPVNTNLAQAGLNFWKQKPDRNSTAKALHIAALADDAALYHDAVETALAFWRAGRLANVSPLELQALFDGEFWVLSAHTRSSGAGFVLKRTLADARRELGKTAGINQ